MGGMDVYCERCGAAQPKPPASAPRSAGALARRVLDAVGVTDARAEPADDWLRLCLSCRGYACPTCWNDGQGACQTCAPLPAPVAAEAVAELAMSAPVVADGPSPLDAAHVQEPAVAAPPEPAVAAQAETEPAVDAPSPLTPEPAFDADLDQVTRRPPRMPVLPLPPPRPVDAPVLPLPPLPTYPVAPQIAFRPQAMADGAPTGATPAYEPHSLLAPPPEATRWDAGGQRPCANCRLALSARAAFCRRCGTAQPH